MDNEVEEYFYFDGETLISIGKFDSFIAAENSLGANREYALFIAVSSDWDTIIGRMKSALPVSKSFSNLNATPVDISRYWKSHTISPSTYSMSSNVAI
jgi:hypothetical protein